MSTSVSRARQQQNSRYQTRPGTPIPGENTEPRKKTWLSTASQRLRMNSLNPKTEPSESGRPRISSPIGPSPHLYTARPSGLNAGQELESPQSPSRATVHTPSSIPRLLHTPATPKSPTDKPLPSLPVATVVSRSPIIRRSLIDATEKPLRRSLSPQPGSDYEEDWPALSPERSSSRADQVQERKMVKPSLGESVIEGMRHLKISVDSSQARSEADESRMSKKPVPNDLTDSTADGKENRQPDEVSINGCPNPPITQPGRIPRKALPPVRQTRTSEMRLRMSKAGTSSSPRSSPVLKSRLNGLHEPGPVRSRSKGRHTATPRGSPYMIPSKSSTDTRLPHDTTTGSNKRRFRPSTGSSPDSEEPPRKTEVISYKDSSRLGPDGNRLTSIPFPSRLLRHITRQEDDTAQVFFREPSGQRKASAPATLAPEEADVGTDANKSAMSLVSANNSQQSQNLASELQQESSLLSFSDMMATMPPIEDGVASDSEDFMKSVRGYDELGGFKIKKLRSKGKEGATLRISDSAHRLLSEDFDDEENDEQVARKSASKRSSIADIRHPSVLKNKLQRSGSVIKNRLELTRSFTERSLAKLSGVTESVDPTSENWQAQEVAGDHHQTPREYSSSAPDVTMSDAVRDESYEGLSKQVTHPEVPSGPNTPISIDQGDWPLKDFQGLAPTITARGNEVMKEVTTWKPPPEWAVREASTSTKTCESLDTSNLAVPYNSFVSELPTPFQQAAVDATTSEDAGPALEPPSTDPTPQYPPRTSSLLSVSRYGARTDVRQLFLSQESNEQSRATGYRQRSSGQASSRLPQPIHTKTVSESFRNLETKFDTVKPAEPEPPQRKSGKKAISTVRGLFHKKSHGSFRARLRRIGGDHKSSTTATPTLSRPNMRKRAIANIRTNCNIARDDDPKSSSGQSSPTFETSALEFGEIRAATETAVRLLEMARDEGPGQKQNQLVEVRYMVTHLQNVLTDYSLARLLFMSSMLQETQRKHSSKPRWRLRRLRSMLWSVRRL